MTEWILILFHLLMALAEIWAGVWLLAFSIAYLRNVLCRDDYIRPLELIGMLWRGEIRRAHLSEGK